MKNNFIIEGDTVIIDIRYKENTMKCLIDIGNFDKVSSFKNTWTPTVKKGRVECVRTRQVENGVRKVYKLHNIITNCPYDMVVDHINGNTLDNRNKNLRVCSQKENNQNVHITKSKTGIRNVTVDGGKYRVRINKVSYGVYNSLEEAVKVAEEKRKLHFNIPDNPI